MNNKFPNVYWIPKLNKNATKASCSKKPLTLVTTLIYKHIENCNFKIQYYSAVKGFRPVKSKQTVNDALTS